MNILLFISIALNIQVALPCIIWVFPEFESGHAPDFADCCNEKWIGNALYSFVEKNSETSHFECNSLCVYEKKSEPNSRYCFKSGGEEHPICDNSVKIQWYDGMETVYKCVNPGTSVEFEKKENGINQNVCSDDECIETPYTFTPKDIGSYNFAFSLGSETTKAVIDVANNCTCPSAGVASHEWSNSLSNVKANLAKILGDYSHPVDKYIAVMTAFFKLNFLVLAPSQEEVFFNSKPCTPLRTNCRLCFNYFMDAPLACIMGNPICEQTKDDAQIMCKRCLCDLSKACFPNTKCPQDTAPMNVPVEESPHPCDRDCRSKNTPMKCVFNFKLEMFYSGDSGTTLDGRRRPVVAYNGMIPGPPIVICEGDEVVVNLENNINKTMANIDGSDSTTTLHFHGIREINKPWSDGVPHVTQCPIPPGGNFTYRFHANHYPGAAPGTYDQTGTYWYHSHVGDQRTNGAYGALIIRPNKTEQEAEFQIDDSTNTIILQEWYESPADKTIQSILINGHGRIDNKSTSTYMEYNVDFDTKVLFRVIGAISEDVPLRLSIDEHTFTAISSDAEDIEHVPNLNYLWIAAGERFDIVVETKTANKPEKKDAYKIRVFGYANPNGPKDGPTRKSGPLCTIAWLKYPGQNVPNEYVGCADFNLSSSGRTLNPVPIDYAEWSNGLNYTEWKNGQNGQIFINALRAKIQPSSLDFFGQSLLNTQYIEFDGHTFNGIAMKYNDVPLLLHDEIEENDICGTVCNFTLHPTRNLTVALNQRYLTTNCYAVGCNPGEFCSCQHVLQQVYAPGYWTEIVLINNKLNETAAHPIHQHGGWYRIVGMGKYDFDINREFIMEKDKDCNLVPFYTAKKNNKTQCLPRNLDLPPAKDTIQVPPGGYVILRTRTDNKGAWIIHCHINKHFQEGMAMIYQVGNVLGKNLLLQDWCTGPLEKGEYCPPRPLGSANIAWYLGMEPVERCVAPGTRVVFLVEGYHNVNELTEQDYDDCNVNSDANFEGEYEWTAPSEEKTYYLACGIGNGRHCTDGMNAKIIVSKRCG